MEKKTVKGPVYMIDGEGDGKNLTDQGLAGLISELDVHKKWNRF